jgi:hypothetical protein
MATEDYGLVHQIVETFPVLKSLQRKMRDEYKRLAKRMNSPNLYEKTHPWGEMK